MSRFPRLLIPAMVMIVVFAVVIVILAAAGKALLTREESPTSPARTAQAAPVSPTPAVPTARAVLNPEAKTYDSGRMKDNEPCLVCHLNFKHETITESHQKAGMTCASCHGDSEAHRADEMNITRPDVLWGRAEIVPFCRQCHKEHKDPAKLEAFHKEWDGKRRPNGRCVTEESVCTDCHGVHAIVTGEGNFK